MAVQQLTDLLTVVVQRIRSDHPERGQGLAEYALILALIALATIVAVGFLGSQVTSALSMVGQSVSDAAP
jgi:Flp pilus assembly pilin Flp